MKAICAAALTIVLVISSAPTRASSVRIGAAAVQPDGSGCVTFRGQPLRAGDRLYVLFFSPPRVVDGVIGARVASCDTTASLEGEAYSIQLRFPVAEERDMGVGVHAPGCRVEYSDGQFVVHTPDAKSPLSFKRCFSSEGIHLTAWRGTRQTWHEYWYLGYDLEGDCTEEEVGE